MDHKIDRPTDQRSTVRYPDFKYEKAMSRVLLIGALCLVILAIGFAFVGVFGLPGMSSAFLAYNLSMLTAVFASALCFSAARVLKKLVVHDTV